MSDTPSMLSRYVIPDMPSADELLPWLRQIDSNRWYSNFGPLVTEFEARLLHHLTARDPAKKPLALTTLMTCYHALQIGLQLFRLPPGANVLVPAVTFPACPLAVQHAGATPVLADVDANNWQLTPQTARAIAAKMPVHAVMPVAVYGAPVLAAEWDAFSEETGIPVIIDAAAALESQDIPQRCLLAHSLHATKPFSVGEGGILISRRAEWIAEARRISNFGMHMRIAQEDGSNAKMSEYHGAVALAQLERWEGIKQRRRKVFEFYRDALKKLAPGFALQPGAAQAIISVFMLQAPDGKSAFAIVDHLNTLGIAAHRMYLPPLYQHPHFAKLAVVDQAGRALPGDAPAERKTALMVNSERMNRSVFGLPFHAFMNETDVAQVLCALADAAK